MTSRARRTTGPERSAARGRRRDGRVMDLKRRFDPRGDFPNRRFDRSQKYGRLQPDPKRKHGQRRKRRHFAEVHIVHRRSMARRARQHIADNYDYVGERFPNEARKMHYGDIEHRPIYGEASPDEARALIDEGVEVSPLPVLPDDRN